MRANFSFGFSAAANERHLRRHVRNWAFASSGRPAHEHDGVRDHLHIHLRLRRD
jgi:hypothetical protein